MRDLVGEDVTDHLREVVVLGVLVLGSVVITRCLRLGAMICRRVSFVVAALAPVAMEEVVVEGVNSRGAPRVMCSTGSVRWDPVCRGAMFLIVWVLLRVPVAGPVRGGPPVQKTAGGRVRGMFWRPKASTQMGWAGHNRNLCTDASFLLRERETRCQRSKDPMVEVASWAVCLTVAKSARPQCSVEPPAAMAGCGSLSSDVHALMPAALDGNLANTAVVEQVSLVRVVEADMGTDEPNVGKDEPGLPRVLVSTVGAETHVLPSCVVHGSEEAVRALDVAVDLSTRTPLETDVLDGLSRSVPAFDLNVGLDDDDVQGINWVGFDGAGP